MRNVRSLISAIVLSLTALGADAQEATPGLYDRPVLVLDPGMHTASLRGADVDTGGQLAVTGSLDGTVRVWSVADGRLIHTIRVPLGPGNVGKIYAVAMSPDGQVIAAGGWTRWSEDDPQDQIYLFDAQTGAMLHRIAGLPNVVEHLAFSPDGRRLAAVLGKGGLRVYDRAAGWAEVARDADYGGPSYGAAFSPDGRLATTSLDGKLRLYDPDGTLIDAIETGHARPVGVAFSSDVTRLAVGFDDTTEVALFDGHSLAPLPGPDMTGIGNGGLSAVAWSADGATLYAGGRYQEDGRVLVVAWGAGGTGPRRALPASLDSSKSLRPLPTGGLFVAAADPWLGVVDGPAEARWARGPVQADFRGQHYNLGVSADGMVVDFGYHYGGEDRVRFDLAGLDLTPEPAEDGRAAPPVQEGLDITGWVNTFTPRLDGAPLPLERYETSRSLAIHPDGERFVLGAEFSLRAFDAKGTELWRRAVPGAVWAVNITGDGRLVVAAYGDGTIRWHRMDNGMELLAFFPLADRVNWIAWEPEGIYAATSGAYGILRWHVNRGWDAAAEDFAANQVPRSLRPEVIKRILPEMETARAIGVAELAERREVIKRLTGAAVAPGAQLHILTVGVGDYGEAAKHLRLEWADEDARDVATALAATQDDLYVRGARMTLRNDEATAQGILDALTAMRDRMASGDPGRDLAVFYFSGHGALVDGEFYLLPYDVDVSREARIKRTGLSASVLRSELAELGKLGRVLVLLDACRSGAATAAGQDLVVDAERLRAALAGTNVTVLTSSSSAELSRERDEWSNGAFTEILLEALSRKADTDANGMISVSELTGYLTRNVPGLTGGKQTPGVEMRFDGDVFLAGL